MVRAAETAGVVTGPKTPEWMPHWTQSIRFRLSITYAATLFAVGSVLIGGMYAWQVQQLEKPVLPRITQQSVLLERSGQRVQLSWPEVLREDFYSAVVEQFENETELAMIDDLRKASLAGLGILVIVAFVSGYILSGLALRPIDRMTRVARDISGNSLTKRIGLGGPEDELKRLGDTFDAMLDRLQAAFEDQRRFIQDTSHELRNPLASARTNLELVLSDEQASEPDLRRAAEVAHRSTERMSNLVDNLLEQARSGVPEVQVEQVDMAAVAAESVADYHAAARKRGLSLTLSVPDETEPSAVVQGDREALMRAVSNLLSNAVRLAPSPSTISVSVDSTDASARLRVADEGPGLSEEAQTKVFTRFWRGERAGPGTGLGLSIVKQIAERHGGHITVESAPGQGSVFALSLPICARARVKPTEPIDATQAMPAEAAP